MTEEGGAVGSFAIPADHPCLPGHFPGHPIIPGVLLLQETLDLLLRGRDDVHVSTLLMAKFSGVVLPGQVVEVVATPSADARLGFTCRVGGATVVRGTVLLGAGPRP